MAYIPTVWQDGDVITAEKLNNGISSKILIANITDIILNGDTDVITGTCEYSFQELEEYINNGYYVMFYLDMAQGLTDPAIMSNYDEKVISAVKIVNNGGLIQVTIVYTEEGLTIEQTAINN